MNVPNASDVDARLRLILDERSRRLERRDIELTKRERLLFRLLAWAGILALGLGVFTGLLLIFGAVSISIATGAMSLVSGGGTATFWRLHGQVRSDRKDLSAQEVVSVKTSEAFAMAQSIPNETERTKAISGLIKRVAAAV